MDTSSLRPNRLPLPFTSTMERYRQDIAWLTTRFTKDPAVNQAALEDVREISSLQSEGSRRYDADSLAQAPCSEAERSVLDQQSGVLRRLRDNSPLDDESRAVLQDVAGLVAEKLGSSEGFVFQPLLGAGDLLRGQAVRMGNGALQVIDVWLHDTPGFEGGLMGLRPLDTNDLIATASKTYQRYQNEPLVRLDHIEDGWFMAGARLDGRP